MNTQNSESLWTPLHAATFQEHGKVCFGITIAPTPFPVFGRSCLTIIKSIVVVATDIKCYRTATFFFIALHYILYMYSVCWIL